MFVFIIIAAIIIMFISMSINSKKTSSTQSRTSNRYPQENGSYNTNQNPMFDSHLCDDNQHDGQSTSFGGFSGNTGTMHTGTALSKYERESDIEELKDLLGAGIISQEEYIQRKRML